MEFYFGKRMTFVVLRGIEQEYLGWKMDAMTCFTERPELFEKGFYGLLGSGARNLLTMIAKTFT